MSAASDGETAEEGTTTVEITKQTRNRLRMWKDLRGETYDSAITELLDQAEARELSDADAEALADRMESLESDVDDLRDLIREELYD